MKPNLNTIKKLVEEKFSGNKSLFSKAIGVERSHISHILSSGNGAGAQFFGGLLEFCEKENLNFKEYIFLPSDVKKMTREHLET